MGWFVVERGAGRILVLLHGIGMTSSAWDPVLERLPLNAGCSRSICRDLDAHRRCPADVEPSPSAIARSLVLEMAARGVEQPFDVVGNSLGGFVALEIAKAGHACSLVVISPGGLWHGRIPRYTSITLHLMRAVCKHAPRLTERILRTAVGRTVGLLVAVCWKGWRVPAQRAAVAARDFAASDSFDAVLEAGSDQFRGGQLIDVPVTVAFGRHDLLLRRHARFHDQLPAQSRWVTIPGSGHVAMWDNPDLVAQIILDGTGVPPPTERPSR